MIAGVTVRARTFGQQGNQLAELCRRDPRWSPRTAYGVQSRNAPGCDKPFPPVDRRGADGQSPGHFRLGQPPAQHLPPLPPAGFEHGGVASAVRPASHT
jgi:hypothetical protein